MSTTRAQHQEVVERFEDSPPIRAVPWLTPRHLILFLIGWLVVFAVISAFVSNPFQTETSAGVAPDYARVMFLHALLVGMVGLAALLTVQIMSLRSRHVGIWVTAGVLVATLTTIAGIFDRQLPGSEVALWTQIVGFLALDEIAVVLLVAMIGEWRIGIPVARQLPFVAALFAGAAMLVAAIMGHLAGWIVEFGDMPGIIGRFAHFAGFASAGDFSDALIGSHSHLMAVSSIALIMALLAQQFGYHKLKGTARAIARSGMVLLIVGSIVITAVYVAMGFTTWQPPNLFATGPGGANAIAGDDIATGFFVGGGSLLVLIGLVLGHLIRQPIRLAAVWASTLSLGFVAGVGYYVEMHETFFGAGAPTVTGAANDAVYTWFHQDIGLFLIPALVLILLAAERLVHHGHPGWIGWATLVGTSIVFVGGLVWVFVNPTLHGPGYLVATAGILIVGTALLATLWWGTRHDKATASQDLPAS
jgi:hypothetical protein